MRAARLITGAFISALIQYRFIIIIIIIIIYIIIIIIIIM